MLLDEIIKKGETHNVEFKEMLPKKSITYMKSVVAFANGYGGKIIFGIEDSTRKIKGIDQENIFQYMDSIANAISDNCRPLIIPNISLHTIDNKTVIVVEIEEGKQKPYYIKSLGKDGGVYIRIGNTTRLADGYITKELEYEGNNISYDKIRCIGLEITKKDIDNLCISLRNIAIKNVNEENRSNIKEVTINQLKSWGILIEKGNKVYPTNAYALLTGKSDINYSIQCGYFKNNDRSIFVDKQEYSGPLVEQIENAYQFVLRNIHLGASIKGLYRQDNYEIEPFIIRELIINAVVHRSYLNHGNIQVAIYDNRLEITSPGKLPPGQTIDKMKNGYSIIRNEALANAFSYMNLIEHWGSGIPRIIKTLVNNGLKEPEFIGGDIDLRINIYRNQSHTKEMQSYVDKTKEVNYKLYVKENDPNNDPIDPNNDPIDPNNSLNYLENKLISLLNKEPAITQKNISLRLNISVPTVKRLLRKLKEKEIIERIGSNRKGEWIVKDKHS